MAVSDKVRLIGPLERALFLKTLGPLEDLSPAEIAVFAENAREQTFRAGETVLRPGVPVEAYHVVVEGNVRAAGGEYLDGETVGPREPLGLLSMLSRRPEGVEAVAEDETITLVFEDDVLYDILEDDFSLVHGLIRRLASRTLEVRRQIPTGTYLAPLEGVIQAPGRSLDLVERIVLLRRPGSPFARSSLDAIAQIARATPEVTLEPGTRLWRTGDRADHMYVIVAGTVACTTQWGASRFRCGPGYPLGNLERFSGDARWYTAVAETRVTALRSDTEALLDVLEDHFDLAMSFLQSMARRVIDIRREEAAPR